MEYIVRNIMVLTKEQNQKGGQNRWKGTTPEERSKEMRRIAKEGWKTRLGPAFAENIRKKKRETYIRKKIKFWKEQLKHI